MAITKVCGIETEYGIQAIVNGDANPTSASSLLINSYVAELERRIGWDFEDESPGRDARGFAREGAMPPEVETHLVNTVLTNGARYYVDHAHPEYSTPECADPLQLVVHDKAGERILARSMAATKRVLSQGERIVVYKNNSDGKGNSYGCHENYLLDRATPFARIVAQFTPHLVTRQIYTGAGKVGAEGQAAGSGVQFQMSQRSDFFEEEVGLETTLKRPIINTRDEPHSDPQKYRRLHVIVGDANLCEVATFLKVGVTALVLAMIEDDSMGDRDLTLATPVRAIREISHDLSLEQEVELRSGARMTAIGLQWELHDLARKYAEDRGLECIGGETVGTMVLDRWEAVLHSLETGSSDVERQVDWVAKRHLIDAYMDRHQISWDDPRVAVLDLQYHDVRPEKSLFARVGGERLVSDEDVDRAISEPPRDTRAYFRGNCLRRFGASIVAANWDSIVFDTGGDPLRRVPMMEPLRGTASHVDTLFEECDSPAELLRRLGS
ncbi:MAG TPA: depupylase/deamidase Dop [Acidimicrobiales bacterium]|nr:depupylase/deamidase Dop [Acidimicrobiales bacterium]